MAFLTYTSIISGFNSKNFKISVFGDSHPVFLSHKQ